MECGQSDKNAGKPLCPLQYLFPSLLDDIKTSSEGSLLKEEKQILNDKVYVFL